MRISEDFAVWFLEEMYGIKNVKIIGTPYHSRSAFMQNSTFDFDHEILGSVKISFYQISGSSFIMTRFKNCSKTIKWLPGGANAA